MTSWSDFEAQAGDLAGAVRERFECHRHAMLATLRRDGSPRISGIETSFHRGDLWLGMMSASVKLFDLLRDARFALHSGPVDLELAAGDAKVAGTAVHVTDRDVVRDFFRAFSDEREVDAPDDAELFRTELSEVVLTRVEGDLLVIDSWRPGESSRRRTRR